MKMLLMAIATLGTLALSAAPAVKQDPVAEGFPVWSGVTAKNYIMGRDITASDLRHRITVVVEVKPGESLHSQLLAAGDVFDINPIKRSSFGETWDTPPLPRNEIFVISVRGGGKEVLATINEGLKLPSDAPKTDSTKVTAIRSASVPMYANLALSEEVNTEGTYPFIYVMGPTGKEPVYKGVLNEKSATEARAAIGKEKKKLKEAEKEWVPFFGNLAEENYPPLLVKTLEKGKTAKMAPLAAVEKALLKDIQSKDAEKARIAQVAYDALEQTRSDLVMRIKMEAEECPHAALYDIQQLLKYWPGERKRLESVFAKIAAVPEANKMAQIFSKLKTWSKPAFTCKNAGEAKKIVAELNKMKKDLEKMNESKIFFVRGAASLLGMQVEELISVIPTRVPEM